MMTDDEKARLGVALNEADLLGFDVDVNGRAALATFYANLLPESGNIPDDPRIQILFKPVGKIIASLRAGRWDDLTANVIPFEIEEFMEVVTSFEDGAIYGWEFIDVPDDKVSDWQSRLSLNWNTGEDGITHTITLFQEGVTEPSRHLDFRVWFDELKVFDSYGNLMSLNSFFESGERHWKGIEEGDPRVQSSRPIPSGKPIRKWPSESGY